MVAPGNGPDPPQARLLVCVIVKTPANSALGATAGAGVRTGGSLLVRHHSKGPFRALPARRGLTCSQPASLPSEGCLLLQAIHHHPPSPPFPDTLTPSLCAKLKHESKLVNFLFNEIFYTINASCLSLNLTPYNIDFIICTSFEKYAIIVHKNTNFGFIICSN